MSNGTNYEVKVEQCSTARGKEDIIAAKIEEVYIPSTVDIQAGDPIYFFERKSVHRMEILVMNYLKWYMKAYTPFNFIEYFLRKMNDDDAFSQESGNAICCSC